MKTLKVLLQEIVSGLKAWVDTNTVHKSGNETIDGTKTFSAPQCYSSNAILFNSSVLPTQNTVPSANINPLRQYVGYGTSYPNSIFIHDTEMRTNGRNHYRWTIYSDDHSANAAMWLVYNPDSEYLRYLNLKGSCVPDANDTYHLGIPTQKWKTLNGVNPGALSLPDKSKAISIDTTNFVYGSNFTFTPTVSGWLFVNVTNCTKASLKTGVGEYFFNQSSDWFRDTFPVIAGEQVTLLLFSTATSAPGITLFPCQGNV